MEHPEKFGRFEVRRVLGRGAMGIVYLADDTFLGRKVAIKTTKAHPELEADEVEDLRQRFVAEARSASVLSHPNLVTVFDVGQEGDNFYIAMEYIRGEGLDKVLRSGRVFSFKEVADLAAQVGSALDYAHANHIVHRDIKPANIMVTRDGRPKIADFGVARRATSTLTRTGTLIGTPAYMSPEQITGHPISGASDQFSFAVVLFRMLTGAQPFEGENPTTVMYKIVHEQPQLPRTFNEELPEAIDQALMRGLAKNPADRYPSCLALAEAVREALGAARAEATEFLGTSEHSAIVPRRAGSGSNAPETEEPPLPKKEISSPDAETIAPRGQTAGAPRTDAIGPTGAPTGSERLFDRGEKAAEGAVSVATGGAASRLRSPIVLGAAGAASVLVVAFLGWSIFGDSGGNGDSRRTVAADTDLAESPASAGQTAEGPAAAGDAAAADETAATNETGAGQVAAPGTATSASTQPRAGMPGSLEITLRTNQDPARVRLNGEEMVDPTPLQLLIEPGQAYVVVVEKDGYLPVSWSFSRGALSAEQVSAQELYFPLRPSPAEGAEPVPTPELPPVESAPAAEAEPGAVDPIRLPGDGERPTVVEQIDPEFPTWAADQGLQAYVVVQLVIDATGKVRQAQALGDGVHPDLDRLAVEAVQQWVFEPARVNGTPVAVFHNLAVVFRR